MNKKVIETITMSLLLTDGDGIIKTLFDKYGEELTFITADNVVTMSQDYYLYHSGEKKVSPVYQKLVDGGEEDVIEKIADIIYNKYHDKWMRLYSVLVESEYAPLENYNMLEVETPNLTDTETPNITHSDTQTQQTNITTTGNSNNDTSVYGFNSANATPQSESGATSSATTSGDAEDNVITKTGTETGTRTTAHTGTKRLERSGNIGVTTSQQMLESEVTLRQRYNFYNIVYQDIDKVFTLSVY